VFAASPTPEPPAPTTPYDAAAEAALPHPLFSTTFQSALKQGPEIAQEATKALEKMQIGVKDAEVSKFLADARALQRFQGTDTRTIAVLGDSGEGKKIQSYLLFQY
jgi:3-mercaptopyruvate sulfurtransferase SseA